MGSSTEARHRGELTQLPTASSYRLETGRPVAERRPDEIASRDSLKKVLGEVI